MKTDDMKRVERWFDGELRELSDDDAAVFARPECQAYLESLHRMHEGIEAMAESQRIEDGQLGAFMAGIRDGVERRAPAMRRMLALASVTTAALIMAVSMYAVLRNAGGDKAHTVVEAATTEIEGAQVETYYSDDGTATAWVTRPDKDLH